MMYLLIHSTLIVTCVLRNEIEQNSTFIPLTHLIARCRVAVNVNKILVLANSIMNCYESRRYILNLNLKTLV